MKMNFFKEIVRKYYFIITGVLFFLSFPSFDLGLFKFFPFFAWIFLIPLLFYVKGRPLRSVFLAAFVTSFAGNFLAYNWIGHFGAKIPGGSAVILSFLIPALSVFFSVKIFLAELLSKKFSGLRFLIYPSVWIIVDWIQSLGFLAFPWSYMGYSQYPFTSFIQLASVTGILGITFFIILANTSLAEAVEVLRVHGIRSLSGSMKGRVLVSVVILFVITISAGELRLKKCKNTGDSLKVAIVQSCISPWENWPRNRFRYLKELIRYTEESLAEKPDFVVWSESATLELISFRYLRGTSDRFDKELTEFIKNRVRVPLLTGEIGLVEMDTFMGPRYFPQNSAVLINGDGTLNNAYAKMHLVPFGEWFPYAQWAPWIQRLVLSFGGSAFVPGEKPVLFEVGGRKFGTLICYEGIFFRHCRQYRDMGADFLVNITNDGWTDAYNGHYQHFSASIFRAIENGIPVVRAGNTGVSAIIDSCGRISETMPILKKGFITGNVIFSKNGHTFYSLYGDIVLFVSIVFIILLLALVFMGYLKDRPIK